MKMAVFLMLLLILGNAHASPALFGLNTITNKAGYVPEETVLIQNSVYYGVENPAYGAVVNNSIVDPDGNTVDILSCTTNIEGICTTNFTITGDFGEWNIRSFTELSGTNVNSTIEFILRPEICGDGICDINEPGYCEEDCGKADGERCSQDGECHSEVCCNGICREQCPFCGDGYCDTGEDCEGDCGPEPEAIISGGGFFLGTSMRIYFEHSIEAFQNSLIEGEIVVENLVNSTQQNTTLVISGISGANVLPESNDIGPLSNHTFILSIPLLAGEEPRNKTIRLMAVSNTSHSNIWETTVVVKPIEFGPPGSCHLWECEDICCENYVCCNGVCREQCPFCGDGYCDIGENCLSCEEDCGQCQEFTITGDRGLAMEMIRNAERAMVSWVLIFRPMLDESGGLLDSSKEFFRALDYENSIAYAGMSLRNTERAKLYELVAYAVPAFMIGSAIAFNKFYKSRKAKKKHGKVKHKKKGKN